ncbi:MAG: hypothetical protein HOW59_04860, partial [Nonomuraea sp.]|nr:hypothetical protein [Nonomuraea sp.]
CSWQKTVAPLFVLAYQNEMGRFSEGLSIVRRFPMGVVSQTGFPSAGSVATVATSPRSLVPRVAIIVIGAAIATTQTLATSAFLRILRRRDRDTTSVEKLGGACGARVAACLSFARRRDSNWSVMRGSR